jgi:hypothetical protein
MARDPNRLEESIRNLQMSLEDDKDALWSAGFLRLTAEDASPSEHILRLNLWHKTVDYRVLYEFHYEDSDGAESLIASIPIDSDLEKRGSLQRETTIVTDEMVRWDQETALPLVVRGPAELCGLALLAYLPTEIVRQGVRVTRTFDGALPADATEYPTLSELVAAGERNARLRYATMVDFVNDVTRDGAPIPLGDWDEDDAIDLYQPRVRTFARRFGSLAIDAADATRVSNAAAPIFAEQDVGMELHIAEGAGFELDRYTIVTVDGAGVATLDRPAGTPGSSGGVGERTDAPTLKLPTVFDRFEIAIEVDASLLGEVDTTRLDEVGVIYLRALGG